jgi:hypothetical protein
LDLLRVQIRLKEGTSQVKRTSWSQGLSVTADGEGVVPLAGAVAVRLLADRVGLTGGLSTALARRGFTPWHDRGQVWVDVATMLAAGGEAIADIDTLRHQVGLLGPVASPPTVWRTLDEATPAALKRVEQARARIRRHVWGLLPTLPVSKVAGADLGGTVVLDVDATLVTAHSEKEQAKATFKGGFGFHPIGVWCDNTTELLAITLRPGNAGSNHAGDHIDVLGRAIAQVPTAYRRRLLVRADGAGATHELLDWLTGPGQLRGLEYSVGFPTKNTALTSAITTVPTRAWTPAVTADGEPRDSADVAEVTGLLDLRRWPAGMRVIVRRERPHPGAQLSLLEEADGWRYQAFVTNTATGQLAFLEARHRAHAPGPAYKGPGLAGYTGQSSGGTQVPVFFSNSTVTVPLAFCVKWATIWTNASWPVGCRSLATTPPDEPSITKCSVSVKSAEPLAEKLPPNQDAPANR